MPFPSTLIYGLIVVAVAIFLFPGLRRILRCYQRSWKSKHHISLPPGPPRIPILGNALQMPRLKEWNIFQQWANIYGDIVWLKVLGRPIVIVNTFKAAQDLVVKRSAIYSSRPHLTMASELVGLHRIVPLMSYSPSFVTARKLVHREFSKKKIRAYYPTVEKSSHRLLKNLLTDPKSFEHHVRDCVGASLMMIVYGYQVQGDNDHMIKLIERSVARFSQSAAPGAYMVDFFPLLKYLPSWLPGVSFKSKAALWKKEMEDVVDYCYATTMHIEVGKNATQSKPCFLSRTLDTGTRDTVNDTSVNKIQLRDLAKWTAISLLGAGADTPVSTLLFFFLAMLENPMSQSRAQAEIDEVVGPDRLPALTDRKDLPFTNAIITELLRWYPVSPVGVPHKVTEDDEYNGWLIPKNTSVVLNQWSMLHDPIVYPFPDSFIPERFLPGSSIGGRVEPPIDPREIAFGFGRRQCPGVHLADEILFSVISNILATFSVTKPVDANGKPYMPHVDCTSGNISFPTPFTCTITCRSSMARTLILNTTNHEDQDPTDGPANGEAKTVTSM